MDILHRFPCVGMECCDTVAMVSRVLFVEDDSKIRQVISASLTDEGFEVVEAPTGEYATSEVDLESLDLAIIDLRLPGINGMDVVRNLRQRTTIPLVILTAHGDSNDVVTGLEAGADDFLNKPIAATELGATPRDSAPDDRRCNARSAVATSVGSVRIDSSLYEATVADAQLHLTRTEFGVLRALVQASPATLSRQALLEAVWGYDYLGDSRLVDMQIYRLRQKLESHGLKEKLLTVRGVGFRLIP